MQKMGGFQSMVILRLERTLHSSEPLRSGETENPPSGLEIGWPFNGLCAGVRWLLSLFEDNNQFDQHKQTILDRFERTSMKCRFKTVGI